MRRRCVGHISRPRERTWGRRSRTCQTSTDVAKFLGSKGSIIHEYRGQFRVLQQDWVTVTLMLDRSKDALKCNSPLHVSMEAQREAHIEHVRGLWTWMGQVRRLQRRTGIEGKVVKQDDSERDGSSVSSNDASDEAEAQYSSRDSIVRGGGRQKTKKKKKTKKEKKTKKNNETKNPANQTKPAKQQQKVATPPPPSLFFSQGSNDRIWYRALWQRKRSNDAIRCQIVVHKQNIAATTAFLADHQPNEQIMWDSSVRVRAVVRFSGQLSSVCVNPCEFSTVTISQEVDSHIAT